MNDNKKNSNNKDQTMEASTSSNNKREESLALKSFMNDGTEDFAIVRGFFENVYQIQCETFHWENRQVLLKNANKPEGYYGWEENNVQESPYEELVHQGWNVLLQLLSEAACRTQSSPGNEISVPLIFKDMSSVSDQLPTFYNNNVFAAYLDGCSVVFNHADWSSPWIAALCLDLQKSFPHTYANTYLTPPNSQAVNAHADDRDVVVIQVVGSKHWKIYQKVPIPYCYPHEQVGKEGLEVPSEVLNGPILHETTLKPGDALYLPRGYVHEARATDGDLSFHVTIAIATHDWTLAGTMTKATDNILHSVVPFRMAMDRHIGMEEFNDVPQQVKKTLQMQIDEAFRMLKEEITAETVAQNQENKFRNHNKRALEYRMGIIQKIQAISSEGVEEHEVVVGPEAAKRIRRDTYIRAATEEEKASIMMDRPRGLQVREQAADEIIRILQALKAQPTLHCKVKDLKLLLGDDDVDDNTNASGCLCDLTLLSFARVCVEQGALAIANK